MVGKNVKYLPAVDHLRALAAILVILYHGVPAFAVAICKARGVPSPGWLQSHNPLATLIYEGHSSVALFMVLSGFIFTWGAMGRDVDYGRFMKNRLLRIYPLYIFLLVVGVYANHANFSFRGFVQSLFFLGNITGAEVPQPFTAAGWAVAVEFQFYLIFPFLLRFYEAKGNAWLLGLLCCTTLARFAGVAHGAVARDLSYWTIVGRLDQFLLGMAAARIYLQGQHITLRQWRWVAAGSTTAVLLGLWGLNRAGGWPVERWWKVLFPTAEGAVWAAFLLGYLGCAQQIPERVSRVLCRIGETSFSLYMLHWTVLQALLASKCYFSFGLSPAAGGLLTSLLVLLPASLLVSFLTFHVIELPFLSMRVRYLTDRATTSESAVPASKSEPLPKLAA